MNSTLIGEHLNGREQMPLPARTLQGKIAVVFMGPSELTWDVLCGCIRRGAKIALLCPSEARVAASNLQARANAAGGTCLLVCGDFGTPAELPEARRRIIDRLGKPEIFLDLRVDTAGNVGDQLKLVLSMLPITS